MRAELIAPCGMNCNICKGYLREKNKCLGCGFMVNDKAVTRVRCKVKNCEHLDKFCFNCEKLPCQRMKSLDKRYRTKYNMSMLENLEFIKTKGMKKFLEKERKKWKCPDCGGVISCHDGICYGCGIEKLKKNKKKNRGKD